MKKKNAVEINKPHDNKNHKSNDEIIRLLFWYLQPLLSTFCLTINLDPL